MKKLHINRSVIGWSMYDFANSAYATTVMSVVFSVYFAKELVPPEGAHLFGMRIPGESLWGYLVALVMVFVILFSPVLGAIADHRSMKRRFLQIFTVMGVLGTGFLFFAKPGMMWIGFILQFLALLGYELSIVFYNAFINDIGSDEVKGTLSGLGFALGYLGGGLCLALNIWMIQSPETFGLGGEDNSLPVRAGMVLVAFWWWLFSIPTFLWVNDKPREIQDSNDLGIFSIAKNSIGQLKVTFRYILKVPNTGRFLLSYIIYNDGIQTLIVMASIFGAKTLNMSTAQLGFCYLMIQFVAFVGALFFGRLADSWSHKKVILLSLVIYTMGTCWAVVMNNPIEFWILGAVVGLILGGSQAASRSLYAVLIPEERSGELFAFYAVVGKAAAFLGPLMFGVVSQFWGLRMGVGSLILFYVVGGSILYFVDENRRGPI